jgi:asparagine synthase (glutamine-hydrolysing)
LPAWLRKQIVGPLGRAWPKADWLPRVLRAKTLLSNLSLSAADAYANTMSLCRPPWRRRLLTSGVVESLNGYRPELAISEHFNSSNEHDWLAQMIASDINVVLPDDFLTKVDRASMSCGLEVRPPLVDHELLELTAQIPSDFKVRNGGGKWIFKQAYRDRIPPAICQRPKQGFEIPIDRWLRGPLRELFSDTVLRPNAKIAELLDQSAVRRIHQSHLSGIGRNGAVLWAILVLSQWSERYLGALSTAIAAEPNTYCSLNGRQTRVNNISQ